MSAIGTAKRAGLPVDLARLTSEGDAWLSDAQRYALKTHGVCAQAQPGVFMIRIRTRYGMLDSGHARAVAAVAEARGRRWIHLTTRQQVELHHVDAREVAGVLDDLRSAGLSTGSACGHTVRGVMSCPEAGVGLEEPFDCTPDADAVTSLVLARGTELNPRMPQRLNVLFGGCAACRDHAKTNDVGFVSVVREDGELGYELWLGGGLGKSVPTLAFRVADFIPRAGVLPAVHAILEVFTAHADLDRPQKSRLKFLVAALGRPRFVEEYLAALDRARSLAWPPPVPLSTPLSAALTEVFARAPEGRWSRGVRPQRIPGAAMVTVHVPLGDLQAEELRALASLCDAVADESLRLTANQNVLLRHVPVDEVGAVRRFLEGVGLNVDDADGARDIRACTAAPVCSLALTPAQGDAHRLFDLAALRRNSPLRVHVSGCPNACAQHQIADIGLSGGRVTIGGRSVLGYQVWLGGDPRHDRIGRVAGRVAQSDVEPIVEAVVGVWEALRRRDEGLSGTIERVGVGTFEAQIAAVFRDRWEPGPEPDS